jgi:pilus assembly protein CpaE
MDNMLRSFFICPGERLRHEVEDVLPRIPEVENTGMLTSYPSTDDLLRIIRVRKLDLLVLDIDDFERAEILMAFLDDALPGFAVLALGSQKNLDPLPKLMRLGVREYLTSPVEPAALAEAINVIVHRLRMHPVAAPRLSDLYTFLPAKPGVGTSTIAVSVSCALAENLGARTLLLDCDLAAGTIQFLLKLGKSASVVDALMHSQNLDEGLWAQMVGKWGRLEALHAGELEPPPQIDPADLLRVLSLARAQYEVICADSASSFDPFSIALMRESRRIFLVTTPEVVPLHLAASRLRRLTELGLQDRVSLLLNRKIRGEFDDAAVALAVGMLVTHCFANDYAGVQGAILGGSPVAQKSDLGQEVLDLANSLVPQLEPKHTVQHRRFLEFFHVPHASDSEVAWHG